MMSRYEVYLNNVALRDIDPRIIILDVAYGEADLQRKESRIAHRDGQFLGELYRAGCTVTVTFQLRIYDVSDRQSACQEIVKWAMKGGKLEINDRPEQMLECVCQEPPNIGSAMKWLDTLSVTFRARSYPFWQDSVPSILSSTGTAQSGLKMRLKGVAPKAYVSVTAKPVSGELTSLTVSVNDSTITVQGISVSSGGTFEIGYDEDMILYIKSGSTSYLDKRTAASSDDLVAKCGEENSFSFSANTSVQITFSGRGAWL